MESLLCSALCLRLGACMSLCVLMPILEPSTAYENYIHEARTGAVTLRRT